MSPLILSLVCLISVGISGNLLSIVKTNKIFLYISIVPCIYIFVYGIYLVFGPVDLYEDGATNFFLKNPEEKELPTLFIILKLYQYILIVIGAIFSYLYFRYLKNLNNKSDSI
tara:strand:- start:841 stop:1179 length:339 start_codon:yes stop_codon:yes gene_type:complete